MTFLNSLLSFERPFFFGKEILRKPRTIKEIFFGNNEPKSYMVHQTRAGLYVVLPHNADGSLFAYPGDKEVSEEKDWAGCKNAAKGFNTAKGPNIANDFVVNKTYQRRTSGKAMTYVSTVSKVQYSPEINMGVKIDVSYSVSQSSQISSLRIGYDLINRFQLIGSRIDFQIYRCGSNSELIAEGPAIKNWKGLEFDWYEAVD